MTFQLTHLLRGATQGKPYDFIGFDISTHAPLARCDYTWDALTGQYEISTHAPLARCDSAGRDDENRKVFQLTHLLRGATNASRPNTEIVIFQLTHLLRGATHGMGNRANQRDYFNSRTSCEVRRTIPPGPSPSGWISTHAPLARCDRNIL